MLAVAAKRALQRCPARYLRSSPFARAFAVHDAGLQDNLWVGFVWRRGVWGTRSMIPSYLAFLLFRPGAG